MPTVNRLEAVLVNHWIITSSGYPVFENFYWTKLSGASTRLDTREYKSPFLGRKFTVPKSTRVIQPIVLSTEMHYGKLSEIQKAYNSYRNQSVTIIQRANLCSPETVLKADKEIKYTGCIWTSLEHGQADRSGQNPSMVVCSFSVTRID